MRRRQLLLGSFALGLSVSDALAAPNIKKKAPPPTRLIALDPGHGGIDPGAIGVDGTQEKGVVISVARGLQRQLMQGGRYRVMLTRAGDTFVPLRERVARAQEAKAELFLSIHADSHPNPSVRGASVYTLSEEGSDREAEALAQRENRADQAVAGMKLFDSSPAIAKTLVSMAQRGTVNESNQFASAIVQSFGTQGVRLLPRSHREAGFAVLTSPDIPAALVELGYLSNRSDEKLLTVPQHQMALGRALRASIDSYFGGAAKA
jgi:N-acetylmuramoyl-L-alanine amidase